MTAMIMYSSMIRPAFVCVHAGEGIFKFAHVLFHSTHKLFLLIYTPRTCISKFGTKNSK